MGAGQTFIFVCKVSVPHLVAPNNKLYSPEAIKIGLKVF